MPLQVFEFHADSTVSLASPAAINRKSCDHCFLNRKTCDKVRQDADLGEKCKRCAKDNRPCTFTPTVHLYHIADCVGRHQCRAKVIQAMGGRKKEVQFKTIEIPIVCDMDNLVDQALFEFIQKQPNLLVYNNRIKSMLAEEILGIPRDHDAINPTDPFSQGLPVYSPAQPVSPYSSSSFTSPMTAPIQVSTNYNIMSPYDPQQSYQAVQPSVHQQQQQSYRAHPYASHQRNNSEDRGRPSPRSHSPRAPTGRQSHSPVGRVSPLPSPNALSPIDPSSAVGVNVINSMNFDQRRLSGNMTSAPTAALISAMDPYSSIYQPQQPQVQQQQQQQVSNPYQQASQYHPYAQQSPYPQAAFFHQPQAQLPQQQQQHQQQQMGSYRNPSPIPSPLAPSPIQSQGSPQPPSPLELSLSLNTNFGMLSNNLSAQNLPSLFDQTLTMGQPSQQQQQQQLQQPSFHHQELSNNTGSSISVSGASPALTNLNQINQGNEESPLATEGRDPAPLVVTTVKEEGREVGLYYAIPKVNLNPGASESDLFQDFNMRDALGTSGVPTGSAAGLMNHYAPQDTFGQH
ncbi:hypothetical protein BCR41DRAFT_418498 [Lobosporangium transversale]|uniref:Zn(2)-C6 fungal-type domain-containing protein n=1 Tax=Lobosporangium transversale TaxID=64571 RepID=A0A1Y2H352_9FUNG|nr:hypothetical protein BCR41DRAFT_418498 [Lobosporangium transversale]ORZ28421.1 hypothetical protein BCR41DRAFT_418498 [Lobosporangium transversale]|eukprot:XP_021886106.1 hypothetical protein BCR41DRAFT_418498 [Lobosporangium transversale]